MTLENRENKDKPEQPSDKQKRGINKKIKRSNKIKKNTLRDFKTFYQHVRDLKSKTDSLAETIAEYEPTLIRLVETHLIKEVQIQILVYKIFRNYGKTNSRIILITIKKN